MKFRMKPTLRGTSTNSSNNTTNKSRPTSMKCLSSLLLAGMLCSRSYAATQSQHGVLKHLYADLNGDNWALTTPWNLDSYFVCNYEGVTCNDGDHIIDITLDDSNCVGVVSPHLYTLPYLTSVDLSKNRITNAGFDRISEVVADDDLLAPIETLVLTNNLINTIEGVAALSDSLTGLHLTYNNLKGSMPQELFDLKGLEILAISENALTGAIPTEVGTFTNLLEFYCYGNQMTGLIPTEIGELTKMQVLTFAENQLEGPLPAEIKNMGNLQTFSVHNNDQNTGSHTGKLPKFDTQSFLSEIYLDGNDFTGTIPPNFLRAIQSTDNSVTIGLSNNALQGSIPVSFLKFDSLVLNIVGNNLTQFDDRICDDGNIYNWMNGLVEMYGCDAILCPVGYYSDVGRQEDEDSACKSCDGGTSGMMGATNCASDQSGSEELPILAEFYLALGGPQWDEGEGWDAFKEMENAADLTLLTYQEENIQACDFHGVTCDDNKKVTKLALSNNGLEGMIPASLWDLPFLNDLDLAGNELRLARDFGFGDIGNAKSLEKVDLSSNDIQSFSGIGKATSLTELVLDDAYFFSALDTEVYQLTNLIELHMMYSGLKDEIPEGISALKSLMTLNLYGNELSGNIPSEIGKMTKLFHVDISENNFVGPLPADAIKNLNALELFRVHQTGRLGGGITGKLPSFKEQTKLHKLDLNSNMMTGSIPSDFLSGVVDTDQVIEINIGYNEFVGTIPSSLKRFSNMQFSAESNKITKVSTDLCSLTSWWDGDVGKVIDGGASGCDAILCPTGTYNDYGRAQSGNNGGCKACSSGIYAAQITCSGVTSETDNFEKKVLDKLYFETGGPQWEENNWDSEGSVCDYDGVTCASTEDNANEGVKKINLNGFGLRNIIPTEIYQLPSLTSVDFSNNNVDMSFTDIGKAELLEQILINSADLTGIFGIGNAKKLRRLHMSHNTFPEGAVIPDEIFSIKTLESLAISFNNFGGSISSDVGKLSELTNLWAGSNEITGSIPIELSELTKLTSIVLSDNRMSGAIPDELENIPTLATLHLHGQRDFGGFTGPVPTLSKAPELTNVDFSNNSLTGSIPSSFLAEVRASKDHDIYAYDKIDLSSNQITGTLPAEWDDFVGLFVNAANNRISGVPAVLCDDDDEFMDGLVGTLTENKCDALLCPPGTFTSVGRATEEAPCITCPGDSPEEQAPYFGSLQCKSISEERKILEELHGLIFTGDSEDTFWMTDRPICSWYGITCDTEGVTANEGVTAIKLESNKLSTDSIDKVSELFFSLPSLERLNIRGNELPLKLDYVGKPPNLEMLQLSDTGLTSIAGIGKATKLKELHFTENEITGAFPEEIFDLVYMQELYTSFNKISGPLPTRIGELIGLKEFYVYTNEMTGDIPTELGNLAAIENLVLGMNNFKGKLPTELNRLTTLKEFSLYDNGDMTGPILEFSKLTKLEKLDLEGNKFTGELPSNFLSGLDSDYTADAENEIILHLASNELSGPLPEGLLSIKNLYLDIVDNQFTEVPESFCKQSDWMNGKVGELASESCHAIACPPNTFSETGRMHSDGGELCKACGTDEAAEFIGSYSCIHVEREVTALHTLYRDTNGDDWDENENWMDETKPICSWFGVVCAGGSLSNNTVTKLALPDNNLDGTLPHEIWDHLPALQTLELKHNQIFMRFDNIDKAKNLEVLYVSDVDIGSISKLGHASALKELHLTANKLKGEIPDDFFDLADTLESLYLAYNSFSGTLSTEFGKFKKLRDFYAYDNDFTGTIPSEFAKLPNLQHFVVAENKLSGPVAEEFSYMPNLKLFSAYRRLKPGPKLSGPLPSFSNVPNLEGLYLDYNHFSGTIPSDFMKASLNSQLITISHNLLSGSVPTDLITLEVLNIEMEGNKITQFDNRFCEQLTWMDGGVEEYGCDAIMCRPGYFSIYGRQNSTDSDCQKCDVSNDVEPTPYWGRSSCDGVVDEKEILELLYSETKGDNWHNNDNWLQSDDICTWFGVDCRDGKVVQSIHLGANNLVGTPPEELFLLKQMHTLWLHSNPIQFKFKGIGKATNLIDLRLDATGLNDVYDVGEAKSLVRLDLKYNQLRGPFPSELLNLPKLGALMLTDNRLTGALPRNFEKINNLVELRLGSNMFSGALASFSELKGLHLLDVSDNDLVGAIPTSFLSSISDHKPIVADLSSNRLSGSVPTQLDRFDQLVIYLRDNKFTELSPTLCDSDNGGWNLRGVELFGCDALMCPPGTANYRGRMSAENNPCMACDSNTDKYGQITCNGMPLEAMSSSSRLVQGVVAVMSSLLIGVFLLYI